MRHALVIALASPLALLSGAAAAAPTFTEMVAMRDSVALATDVYLPSDTGPWPVLLFRTPYDKTGDGQNLVGYADIGIAVVIQDMRGRFASEGVDMVFTSDGDGALKDGYDTMAWIVAQGWCDGHIGTTGGSARGIVQYMQTSSAPPGLVVVNAVVATPDLYRHALFSDGAFRESLVVGWLEAQQSLHFLDEIAAHPYDDGYWDPVHADDKYAAVMVPGLHEGGWYDIFLQGNIDGFLGYQHQGGPGAAGAQKLIIGPWTHGGMYATEQGELVYPPNAAEPPYPTAFETLFNHYLEYGAPQITDTPDDVPTLQYYVMGDVDNPAAPGNVWRTATDWPPPAAPVRMHLQADGSLAESCPTAADGSSTYQFDPADPSPTLCGANLNIPAGSCDQRPIEARSDVLVFSTPVLAAPLEITGRVRAHLFVDIDQPDADLMVRMSDVYPDGRSMLVADGARRLAVRADASGLVPLTAGEIVEAVVDLWSTSIVLDAGHRLRISVTSSNYPRFAANRNRGLDFPAYALGSGNVVAVQVHHDGAHASYLEAPDPSRDSTDFVACDETGGGGSGGGAGGAGGSGASGAESDESDGGCGCRAAGSDRPNLWLVVAALGVCAAAGRRRWAL